MKFRTGAGLLVLSFLLGCPARVGPYVTDIYVDDHGRIVYQRCYTELQSNGFSGRSSGSGSNAQTSTGSSIHAENAMDCETRVAPGSGGAVPAPVAAAVPMETRSPPLDVPSSTVAGRPARDLVKLMPPTGFIESERFGGWELAEQRSFISVEQLDEKFSTVRARYLDNAALAQDGFKAVSREELRTRNQPALLVYGTRRIADVPYREWVLIRENKTVAVLIRGAYPAVHAEKLARAVEDSIRGSELTVSQP